MEHGQRDQTMARQPQTLRKNPHSLGKRVVKWMCKDLRASTIMMSALTVIALVYAIESKKESV
jgi:hypothetical protein